MGNYVSPNTALSSPFGRLLLRGFQENVAESFHKRAFQILHLSGPGGLSKSEFTRKTQFLDHRQRDGVLRTLVEANLIEVTTLQYKGRMTQRLKTVGNNNL